ncbi:MAG: hypothetical protein AAF438_14395 [Pseudomonadota bacterium]
MKTQTLHTRLVQILWLLSMVGLIFVVEQANSQSIIRSNFDHDTTTFRLEGAHVVVSCSTCHNRGVFSGAPLQCSGCHSPGRRIATTFQPARHILTSQQCDSCHRSDGWVPVQRVDHMEVTGTCFSCHNNRIAPGKPFNHLPTTDVCEDCHRSVAWTPTTFSHNQALATCSTCHNGVLATGQHPQHIPTTAECDTCHNTTAWR